MEPPAGAEASHLGGLEKVGKNRKRQRERRTDEESMKEKDYSLLVSNQLMVVAYLSSL